ncbi:hypothetical protein E3O55_04150 [Cryobacterium sp. MDB1-18-2]|uniref:DNA methyltransferase n=1 Tax=unclassified Cryobacterium TaxID=2649013 RepID=UPI00106A7E3D|nr:MULTISPECIES: DNA methyltransferase [unclassified Cryobacterium]TFC33157.1 hypothetical protein E3O55_04150 [Cryobacterium sp. MDB1-18-2]TFC37012.1 hypothetical protein E3O50_18520 [Cryobacterium sp. MDB1-18-1]
MRIELQGESFSEVEYPDLQAKNAETVRIGDLELAWQLHAYFGGDSQCVTSLFSAAMTFDPTVDRIAHWNGRIDTLGSVFPEVAARARLGIAVLSKSSEGRRLLGELFGRGDSVPPEFLGDMYQNFGRAKRNAASREAHLEGSKFDLEGTLAVTQFLTDKYMVDWLVEGCLPDARDIDVILDPAVGGGNFLLAALRRIVLLNIQLGAHFRESASAIAVGRLRGYDLDEELAQLASIAVWIEASRLDGQVAAKPTGIFGDSSISGGSLQPELLIKLTTRRSGQRLIILTNPPFLGRRLMGEEMRINLANWWPSAGTDLCAAFVLALSENTQYGDVIGLVHQATIVHLSLFSQLRHEVMKRCIVEDSVNLGSQAFRAISGDKTRVHLTILRAVQQSTTGHWRRPELSLDLFKRAEKIAALRGDRDGAVKLHPGETRDRGGRSHEFNGLLDVQSSSIYSAHGRPMQGTSTGDNSTLVRFAWEVPAGQEGWVPASKGGGYCKWWGLNYYMVNWGIDGSRIRSQSGSALRNPQFARSAQLVWSDTGTRGLNVRLKRSEAVFMAAGPGILVTDGDPMSHLAVLNSRLASAVLASTNPKLTLAAGYLGKLPFSKALADDPQLAQLAAVAVGQKRKKETRSITSSSFLSSSPRTDLVQRAILAMRLDVENETERLVVEGMVETRVRQLLLVSNSVNDSLRRFVGVPAAWMPKLPFALSDDQLDYEYSLLISPALDYAGRIRSRIAVEGPIEAIAQKYQVHPEVVSARLLAALPYAKFTMRKYIEYELHSEIVTQAGFRVDRQWSPTMVSISEVLAQLEAVCDADRARDYLGVFLRDWLTGRFPTIHNQVFLRRPIVSLTASDLALSRRLLPS